MIPPLPSLPSLPSKSWQQQRQQQLNRTEETDAQIEWRTTDQWRDDGQRSYLGIIPES